ncbi:hypothetical protein Droror1_Dr00015719 [Drosera rotundifolia]
MVLLEDGTNAVEIQQLGTQVPGLKPSRTLLFGNGIISSCYKVGTRRADTKLLQGGLQTKPLIQFSRYMTYWYLEHKSLALSTLHRLAKIVRKRLRTHLVCKIILSLVIQLHQYTAGMRLFLKLLIDKLKNKKRVLQLLYYKNAVPPSYSKMRTPYKLFPTLLFYSICTTTRKNAASY